MAVIRRILKHGETYSNRGAFMLLAWALRKPSRRRSGDTVARARRTLGGSSYYVLPPLLQWFTDSVGLHHVHHLNSRIPNYRLQECLDGHTALGQTGRLTLRDSLNCLGLALWDEDARKLVEFTQVQRPQAV